MATKLDDLSLAIGALQEGQRQAERQRQAHAASTETKFDQLNTKLDAMAETIDTKVQKATNGLLHGSIGGAVIVGAQYLASVMGLKLPGGHP